MGSSLLLHFSTAHAAIHSAAVSLSPGSGRAIDVTTFVEPAAGETPILNAINNATTSIAVELYLLTDNHVIQALENAAHRGLNVRVILDPDPFGVGTSEPAQTLQTLSSAGVQTEAVQTQNLQQSIHRIEL